ncbi:MAG: glycosyltransferase family 2 protein, partial [Desulfuromonadales bacterium]|nr:glycosyltransferase family 2 protein [Desulfuromonadales bacterium]
MAEYSLSVELVRELSGGAEISDAGQRHSELFGAARLIMEQSLPEVYIIILNWESYADTIECVEACRNLNYSNFRILLIDNGSRDRSEQILRERFPEIELLQTGSDLGYAAGNNIGIRYALARKADYVWILNPDLLVEEDSLTELIKPTLEHQEVGLCGPRLIHGEKLFSFVFDGLSLDSWDGYQSHFNIVRSKESPPHGDLLDVDCVSGSSMLVKSEVFRDIGLLREDFFLYYEDAEFCFRARANHWRTPVCPWIAVRHAKHRQEEPKAIGFYPERSRIVFSRLIAGNDRPVYVTAHNWRLLRDCMKSFR